MADTKPPEGPATAFFGTVLIGLIPMGIAIWYPKVGFSLLALTTLLLCVVSKWPERIGSLLAAGCMVAFVLWGRHHDAEEAAAKQAERTKAAAARVTAASDRVRAAIAPVLDRNRPLGDRAEGASGAVTAIDAAHAAGATQFDGLRASLAAVVEATKAISDLDSQIAAAKAAAVPPTKPEYREPVYEKPEYTGAIRIKGKFRSKFDGGWLGKDGIIVQVGSKFLVVVGAERSELAAFFGSSEVTGYATPSGSTTTLNIGRDGREAEVWAISDQETFDDDQRHYKEELVASKRAHLEAVASEKISHKQAMIAYQEALEKYTADAAERAKTLNEGTAQFAVLQERLAKSVESAAASATPLLAGAH